MQHQTNLKSFRTKPRPPPACPRVQTRAAVEPLRSSCVSASDCLMQTCLVLRNIAKGNRDRGTLGTFVRNQSTQSEYKLPKKVFLRCDPPPPPPPSLAHLRESLIQSLPITSGNVIAEGIIVRLTTAHISMINSPFLVLPEGEIHRCPPLKTDESRFPPWVCSC